MEGSSVSPSRKLLSLFTDGKDMPPLRAGEVVTAEVLDPASAATATIRLKNAVLALQAELPLTKGDLLTLRVEKEENAVYLRLAGGVEPPDTAGNAAMPALSDFERLEPMTEAMTRLVSLLSLLPEPFKESLPELDIIGRFLVQIERLTGKAIRDMVQNGGTFFEAKLRILADGLEADGMTADLEAGHIIANDLKAALLRLKDTILLPTVLEHISACVSPGELLGALNTVLRNIEYFQIQSKLTDSLHLFLPLVWRQLKDGEIIIREYDHGDPVERAYVCTVGLELERAGKVRVHMILRAGCLSVTCAADNGGFARLLQDGAQALEQQFRSSGLRLGGLGVRHEPGLDVHRDHNSGGLCIRA